MRRPGSYSIGATCKNGCEVWWKRVEEEGLDDDGSSTDMIIKIKSTYSGFYYEE